MLFLPALHCAVLYSVMPYVMAEQQVVCVTAVSMVGVAESVSQHSLCTVLEERSLFLSLCRLSVPPSLHNYQGKRLQITHLA